MYTRTHIFFFFEETILRLGIVAAVSNDTRWREKNFLFLSWDSRRSLDRFPISSPRLQIASKSRFFFFFFFFLVRYRQATLDEPYRNKVQLLLLSRIGNSNNNNNNLQQPTKQQGTCLLLLLDSSQQSTLLRTHTHTHTKQPYGAVW